MIITFPELSNCPIFVVLSNEAEARKSPKINK